MKSWKVTSRGMELKRKWENEMYLIGVTSNEKARSTHDIPHNTYTLQTSHVHTTHTHNTQHIHINKYCNILKENIHSKYTE